METPVQVETPEQLLARLERMGEERVRVLLGRRYFESRTLPLIQGWLSRKEQARAPAPHAAPSESEEALRRARQADEAATAARALAAQAVDGANAAHRFALFGIVFGSAGLLVSILALLALALR
jgi:hypothetical protein